MSHARSELVVTRLRCEYRANPEGIGETAPRLGWELQAKSNARGVRQTDYEILVASSPDILKSGQGDLWDTGKVASDATQQIVYGGKPLTSREQCWWAVRVWDENGKESEWSARAYWSMGLLQPSDWRAQWIGFDTPPSPYDELTDEARARLHKQRWAYAPLAVSKTGPLKAYVRGVVTLPSEKKLRHAALALSPDQVCTVTVNGKSVGEITRWEQMRPVDVTAKFEAGENVIGLIITQYDGYRPAALGEVELEFSDHSTQVFPIDASWKFATNAMEDWDRAGYAENNWQPLFVDPQRRNPWDGPPETFTQHMAQAPFLRKTFTIPKPVRRATIYSTALGMYELHLNGTRVGTDYFTPGWTDFHSRVQYQTYDVTKQVREGANVLGAILGDGWYASVLAYTGQRHFYGGYPRLLTQLEVEYADGTRDTIVSDGSWRCMGPSPIRSADLMAGCTYNSLFEQVNDDWMKPGTNIGCCSVNVGLRAVDPEKPLSPFKIEAANADASRITEELPARSVTEPRPGAWTFDLGQNISGWARLKVRGRAGQKIMVRHGEALNPNGTVYTSNLRGANATDVYYLRGGTEILEPYFTFHGFRYAEVTGLEEKPTRDTVTGIVVHTPIEQTGHFDCSDPLVNQLMRNIFWSQRDNFVEVPTDCPQRDERAGWTGDAQFFVDTAAYNANVAAFYTRWLTTLCQDSQLPSGAMANVAPRFGSPWASAGWGGDAAIRCVYTIYRVYGDTRIVERNYDAMARYLAWFAGGRKNGDITTRPLGDHLNLGGGANSKVIERAYLANLSALMSEMAAAIGKTDDAARYRKQSEEVKASFQHDFIEPDGTITNSSQTGYALAFTMNLVPPAMMSKVGEKFVDELKKTDWHLATGFIGTPRLLPGLHDAGHDDAAYRVLLQETYPSWLFPVKNGATTVWERWDGWTPEKGFQTIAMNSFNHYSFGAVGEYLYQQVAGIDTDGPGYRKIVVHPAITTGLKRARASYDSPAGRIESAWQVNGKRLRLDVTIPPNTTATVYVPTKTPNGVSESGRPAVKSQGVSLVHAENGVVVFGVESGTYRFESEME